MNNGRSTRLPLRHQLLVAAAFVTAVGTGYVANLDESSAVLADDALLPVVRSGRPAAAAANPGRAASLARGDWPETGAEALQAWGAASPAAAPRGEAARPRDAAVQARASAAAAAPAPVAAPELLPPPAWRYIGRISDDGPARALLATAQQVQVVAERDMLDGRWRVQRIDALGVELRALGSEQPVMLAWEAP
jgi:hypothetical protein